MKLFGIIQILLMLGSFYSLDVQAQKNRIIVREGDSLSKIAKHFFPPPIYSKNGSLQKLLTLNPSIKNSSFIKIGQEIFLSDENELTTRSIASEESTIPEIKDENIDLPKEIQSPPPEVPMETAREVPMETKEIETNTWGAKFGTEYFSLNAIDNNTKDRATITSNLSPSASIYWQLAWSTDWYSQVSLHLVSDKISNYTNATSSLLNASGNRSGFDFSVGRIWSKRSRTNFSLGNDQYVYVRALSASRITLDRVRQTNLKVAHEFDVRSTEKSKIGFGLSGTGMATGHGPGYKTKAGLAIDASTYFRTRSLIPQLEISSELSYGLSQQNSRIVNQSGRTMKIFLGISKTFGE